MLDSLSSGLKDAFRKIAGMSVVDKATVEAVVRDIQRVLLSSDVDVKLVFDISARIKDKILKQQPPAGMTVKEFFLKTLYDEMSGLLGTEAGGMEIKPQRILLVGLFGSGKTTHAAKLARWFKTRGLKPALVACDTHRAAAQAQLSQLGDALAVPVYKEGKKPEDIAKNALKKSREEVIIFDSAGRDALDGELAKELKAMEKAVKPNEVLLVIPADIGQAARKQAEEFNRLVGITGIIVTKLDGTAKGGGALAAASVSGAKVRFIGVGEKSEDLELYDPKRFFSRLVGYGDIQGLLEKAKEAGIDEDAGKRMLEGKFTLADFQEQIKSMQKMGSMSKILEMVPGLSGMKMPAGMVDVQEGKMKKWAHIINSMTSAEREDPEVMNAARIERVAKGAGVKPEEVRELLKQYKQMKKIMKMTKGGKAFKRGPFANIARQMGMNFK